MKDHIYPEEHKQHHIDRALNRMLNEYILIHRRDGVTISKLHLTKEHVDIALDAIAKRAIKKVKFKELKEG
jgi:hypothetical protein